MRGLFASNEFMALEVCDTRDFDGALVTPQKPVAWTFEREQNSKCS